MDEIARLLAVEEIQQLKAKYFLGIDTQDWALIRGEVLTEGISFQLSEFREEPYVGIDEVIGMFELGLKGMYSVHHGHMPVIDVTSETAATGLWAMEDRIYWGAGHGVMADEQQLLGFGHYHETYVKTDRGWRIETIRLTRLRKETRAVG